MLNPKLIVAVIQLYLIIAWIANWAKSLFMLELLIPISIYVFAFVMDQGR